MTVNPPESYVEVTIRPGIASDGEGALKRMAKDMVGMATSLGSVIVIKNALAVTEPKT